MLKKTTTKGLRPLDPLVVVLSRKRDPVGETPHTPQPEPNLTADHTSIG